MKQVPEKLYSVVTVPDKDAEPFSKSHCTCIHCLGTHSAVAEWDTFVPTTQLQKGMKKVIAKLENTNRRKRKKT